MVSTPGSAKPPIDIARIGAQFQEIARHLNTHFLDKQEIIRLLVISAIAGEHMVLVGPPGKSSSRTRQF
jgi:MoxR-like ATPase